MVDVVKGPASCVTFGLPRSSCQLPRRGGGRGGVKGLEVCILVTCACPGARWGDGNILWGRSRGLHSFTSQLNLSRSAMKLRPNHP